MADLREQLNAIADRLSEAVGGASVDRADALMSAACADLRAIAAQPAPAGEVALPAVVAYRWNFHGAQLSDDADLVQTAKSEGLSVDDLCTLDDAIAYGDARAAAAGAKVPDGWQLVRKEAIDWLNGESDFECPPDLYFRGEPPRYWWRSVFREKAGLAAAPQPQAKPNAWPDEGPYEGPIRLDEAIAWMVDAIRDGEGHAEVIRRAKCVKAALRLQPEAKAGAGVNGLFRDAIDEASKRWPDSIPALLFLSGAVGPTLPVTGDDLAWARAEIAGESQPKPAEGVAVVDGYPHEAMDAIAVSRYRVVPTTSGFWPYAVRAGDGEQDLYKGHEKTCMVVAQRLAGAFLDGGLVGFDLWRRSATCAPAGSGEAVAWMHDDGDRVIHARTKAVALRDGGASASSVAAYSVPLYTRPTPAADAGGVTLAMIKRGVDAWYASTFTGGGGLHLRIAEVLTAALTPEVRHGE